MNRRVLVETGLVQESDPVEPGRDGGLSVEMVLEDDLDESGMAQRGTPRLPRELLESHPPGAPVVRDRRHLGHREVGDRVQQLLLVAQVPVERHRAGAERGGDAPHRDGVQPVAIGELERRGYHPLPVERPAR